MALTLISRLSKDADTQALKHPVADGPVRLDHVWHQAKGDRKMPRRSDISPKDFLPYLENIWMIDVIDQGTDYGARLVGSEASRMAEKDFTNLRLSQAPFPMQRKWKPLYDRVVDDRRPFYFTCQLDELDKRFFAAEIALFPLSENGDGVDKLLNIGVLV